MTGHSEPRGRNSDVRRSEDPTASRISFPLPTCLPTQTRRDGRCRGRSSESAARLLEASLNKPARPRRPNRRRTSRSATRLALPVLDDESSARAAPCPRRGSLGTADTRTPGCAGYRHLPCNPLVDQRRHALRCRRERQPRSWSSHVDVGFSKGSRYSSLALFALTGPRAQCQAVRRGRGVGIWRYRS